MKRIILQLIFVLIIPVSGLFSQDFHYSQFYNEPLNFNPSLTGVFDGNKRMILSMRDQYRSIPVPYFTFSGSYDMKFLPKKPARGFFSGGAVFNYDRQGSSALTLFNLNIAGSYTYFLNNKNLITGGALLGYSNKGFSEDNLSWDHYWDPVREKVNPSLGSGENFEKYRFNYIETGLGLNYRYQHSYRNNLTLGVSAFHLNMPGENFTSTSTEIDKLDMRFSLMGILNIKIAQSLDLQGLALYQLQDVYKETVVGGMVKIYLNNKPGKKLGLHVGLLGRLGEGLAPKFAIQYNDWYVSVNYDVVTKTDLSKYTNYRGGPEVHVRYIIKNVKPFGEFKICPIY